MRQAPLSTIWLRWQPWQGPRKRCGPDEHATRPSKEISPVSARRRHSDASTSLPGTPTTGSPTAATAGGLPSASDQFSSGPRTVRLLGFVPAARGPGSGPPALRVTMVNASRLIERSPENNYAMPIGRQQAHYADSSQTPKKTG